MFPRFNNQTFALVGSIALAILAGFTGLPVSTPETLAGGFDMLPLVFLGNVAATEVKALLDQMNQGLETFRKSYDAKLQDLEAYAERLEARMNRPGAGAVSANPPLVPKPAKPWTPSPVPATRQDWSGRR